MDQYYLASALVCSGSCMALGASLHHCHASILYFSINWDSSSSHTLSNFWHHKFYVYCGIYCYLIFIYYCLQKRPGEQCSQVYGPSQHNTSHRHGQEIHHFLLLVWRHTIGVWTTTKKLWHPWWKVPREKTYQERIPKQLLHCTGT